MRIKLLFILLTLLLYCGNTIAQSNLQVQILNNKCDSIFVQTNAFFTLGSGATCPPLVGYTYNSNADTVSLSLYYNTAGFWPANFCNQIDTLLLIIPSGTITLSTQAFSIVTSDTTLSPDASTVTPVCITGISDIPHGNENFLIKPNPVENILNIEVEGRIKIEMVFIYDVLGNLILKQSNNNWLNVSGLNPGFYLLSIETEDGMIKKKFLKK